MKNIKALFGIIFLTLGVLFQTQAQDPFTNGLVAYYPFNGNANDASGNGNNGSLVGSDKKFLPDRLGYTNSSLWLNTTSTPAWNLNGAYADVPRSTSLDFNLDFTLSVWVNLSVAPSGLPENLISNGRDDSSINLRISANNPDFGGKDLLQFIMGGPGSDFYVVLPQVRDAWWQTTIVRSGNNVSMFKNGSLLTNVVMTTTVNQSMIWLGRFREVPFWNGSAYPLIGGIDDVRMYNRALSGSEVQQLYEYESGPRVGLIKAVKPSFSNTMLGANYQLQVSGNLNNWTNQGSVFTATNTSMVYPQYWDVDNWGSLFFRLQVSP
jgi:hypothetical protein